MNALMTTASGTLSKACSTKVNSRSGVSPRAAEIYMHFRYLGEINGVIVMISEREFPLPCKAISTSSF